MNSKEKNGNAAFVQWPAPQYVLPKDLHAYTPDCRGHCTQVFEASHYFLLKTSYDSLARELEQQREFVKREQKRFDDRVAEITKAYANVAAAQFMADECDVIRKAANELELLAEGKRGSAREACIRDVATLRHTEQKLSGLVDATNHKADNERLREALRTFVGWCDKDVSSEPDSQCVEVPRFAVEDARAALQVKPSNEVGT